MSDNIQITAHSGSDGTPDNSLACVEYALSTAVDAFEVDVRRLADGTLALGHDAADHTAPTLREVLALAAAKPGVRINCDLKERGLEPAVAALAAECGMSGRLILSGSVDVDIFAAHPELHDCAEVYLNYRNIPDFELTAAEIITKVCREHGIATVNMNQVLITRRFIETLKDSGIALSAWTVNEEIFLDWFLKQGVRNITTRRPALALRLRDR